MFQQGVQVGLRPLRFQATHNNRALESPGETAGVFLAEFLSELADRLTRPDRRRFHINVTRRSGPGAIGLAYPVLVLVVYQIEFVHRITCPFPGDDSPGAKVTSESVPAWPLC